MVGLSGDMDGNSTRGGMGGFGAGGPSGGFGGSTDGGGMGFDVALDPMNPIDPESIDTEAEGFNWGEMIGKLLGGYGGSMVAGPFGAAVGSKFGAKFGDFVGGVDWGNVDFGAAGGGGGGTTPGSSGEGGGFEGGIDGLNDPNVLGNDKFDMGGGFEPTPGTTPNQPAPPGPGEPGFDPTMDPTLNEGDAAIRAAQIQAEYQNRALDYLMETNQIPRDVYESALTEMSTEFGDLTKMAGQDELLDRAKKSPLFAEIMGTKDMAADRVMRNAGMTGGLRSGNAQSDLYQEESDISTRALTESYNQEYNIEADRYGTDLKGLTSLLATPTNEKAIADATGDIGRTLGTGQYRAGKYNTEKEIGDRQTDEAGDQQEIDNWMGAINTGMEVIDSGMFDSIWDTIENIWDSF